MDVVEKRLVIFITLIILMSIMISAQDNTTGNTTKKKFTAAVNIQEGSHSDYNLRIETAKQYILVEPGKEGSFKLFLTKNPEGEYLHDLKVEILNNEFETRINNPYIEEFKNEELHVMDVIIIPPEELAPDDYRLLINVSGREFLTGSYDINTYIRVGERSYLKDIIFSVLIIGLIGFTLFVSFWQAGSAQETDEAGHKIFRMINVIKLSRFTAWASFFLLIAYFLTGYSMTGRIDFIDVDFAKTIHTYVCIPAIIVVLTHSLIQGYFAFRRWGWIKKH